MSLRELYQEMIIDHSKQPRNFGSLQNATHSHLGHNPLCGDKLVVYVTVENDSISDVRFEGTGCAISIASASLMTDSVKGKTTETILQLFDDFHHLVTQGDDRNKNLGKLTVLGGVIDFPIRVKCATLAWHTLKAALINEHSPSSTE